MASTVYGHWGSEKGIAALKKLKRAAYSGDSTAQELLGGFYYMEGHLTKSAYWYRKAAEQGYADAQTNLGVNYETGLGVPKDYPKAVYWFKKAAASGQRDRRAGSSRS